ncbi:OppA family ABC transporter substrate-binding lipoprotein [[Mycoplasma] testudinis]|uniref:OppA family ABC transporter substrate-binding lipoprotein n=1 Tax=[Mycoplasma] testudinis TaxID=33924 RepID=UPI00048521A9|nr:hypothetical protein [[Mycoplasma] testudinis]
MLLNTKKNLNKHKRRKIWFFSAGFALISSTGIIAAACGPSGSVGNLSTLPQSRTYVQELNSTHSATFGSYDRSASFGGQLGILNEASAVSLIRQQFEGQAVTERDTVVGQPVSQEVTVTPTFWHFRLELADSVIVTKQDNSVVIFSNDKHEIKPAGDLKTDKGMRYKNGSVQAISNDPESINSKNFIDTLQGAVKVQFTVRQNVPWVDYHGNIVNDPQDHPYMLSAEDFYASWKRTNLFQNFNSRYAPGAGGSKELDQIMRKIISPSDRRPFSSTQQGYANSYVYNLFGIDNSKFDNESDFINDVKIDNQTRKAITFDAIPGTGIQAINFMNFFSDDLTMIPAPSKYIEDHIDNPILINQNDPAGTQAINDVKEALAKLPKTAEVRRYGIYWYGQDAINTLTVGPYYAMGYNSSGFRETWQLNKHYWDQSYVNDPSVLLVLQQLYQQVPQSASAYNTQLFRDYIQGVTSNASYANLSDSDRATVDENAAQYGLARVPAPNVSNSITRQTPLLLPFRTTSDTGQALFNDNYMKLVYGGTLDQVKNGTLTKVLSHSAGEAAAFRSIVQAAINWESVKQSIDTSGNSITWLSRLAPDSFIDGKDGSKNPRDPNNVVRVYSEKLNTRQAWNANGTPVNGSDGTPLAITPKLNDAASRRGGENQSFQSAGFAQLQVAMKNLLDQFFKENPTADKSIKWALSVDDSTNPTAGQINAEKRVVDTIKLLDPEGRLQPSYRPVTGADQFNDLWFGSHALMVYDISSWSYDYNGIGSGFDQFSWQSDFIPYLGVLGNALQPNSTNNSWALDAQKATPEIAKAAIAFVAFLKSATPKINLAIPVEQWDNLPTWIVAFDPEKENKDNTKGGLIDPDNGGNLQFALANFKWDGSKVVTKKDSETFTDPSSISARFWNQFQRDNNNADLIELSKEMTNFLGVQVSASMVVPAQEFAPALRNPGYLVPTSPSGTVNFSNYRLKL